MFCGYSFELHRQVDAIQMGSNNIRLYKEVDKKYTGYNLKTTELLDCALIGVCAVIRLNTVHNLMLKSSCALKHSDQRRFPLEEAFDILAIHKGPSKDSDGTAHAQSDQSAGLTYHPQEFEVVFYCSW